MKSNQLLLTPLLFVLIMGCTDPGKQQQLMQENEELKNKIQAQKDEIINVNRIADDYLSQINNLKDEIYAMETKMGVEREPLYPEVYIKFLDSVQEGWEEVFEGSSEKLLNHFLPEYTVNGVRFFGEDGVSVGQGGNDEFEQYLVNISQKNLKISAGRYNIGYFYEGTSKFTISLKTTFQIFNEGQTSTVTSIQIISGSKENGIPKIGNFSWVTVPNQE